MKKKKFEICDDLVGPSEIEEALGLKARSGYPIIKAINDQLLEEGKIICPGKIPRDIFNTFMIGRRKRKGRQ